MNPSFAMRNLGGLRYGRWAISHHFAAAGPRHSARHFRPDAAGRAVCLRLLVRVADVNPDGFGALARIRLAYDATRRLRLS